MLYEETVGFIILYFVNQVDLDFKLRRFHDFVSSIIRKKTGVVKVCSSKLVATLTLCNCLAITGITLFSTV
jgi:hypothetical protein